MGDNFGDGASDEKPVHDACVSDFAIGKYEVTQGQWRKIMSNNPSKFSFCGNNCPVENISWDDSQVFIRKLNSQSGRSYRLPTEAEWEYAARSGGKQEKYSGSDNVDAVSWHSGNSERKTHAVGQKQPNGLGLYDMSGNVWEWVQDGKGGYASVQNQQDPQQPFTGSYRVFRGGSSRNFAGNVRATNRNYASPGERSPNVGLRLASPIQ
jgi:formylglycine-generating enzyme required for sulfatase activity